MAAKVTTGLARLASDGFKALSGRRVGLVTNPTGVLPDGTPNMDAMRAAGVKLVALYGPEHGVRGNVAAGRHVASGRDAKTGLPVFSLYGSTLTPTPAMLKGVDLLLFDIQDVGARSYTYLSTLGAVLEGASRAGVPVTVLDRPNPSGLNRVEGGPTRPGFGSFISRYPVAYLHGLTLGEAARLLAGEGLLKGGARPALSVVACEGLRRAGPENGFAAWPTTGLPWVPTSPNVPHARTALFYAATGIFGELPTLSIGIGTPYPFEVAGRPGLSSGAFARALERELAKIPNVGYSVRPLDWTPAKGGYARRRCSGVRFILDDPARAALTAPNFALLAALRSLGVPVPFSGGGRRMFDLSCGSDRVRRAFAGGADAGTLWAVFNEGRDAFATRRGKYLLY